MLSHPFHTCQACGTAPVIPCLQLRGVAGSVRVALWWQADPQHVHYKGPDTPKFVSGSCEDQNRCPRQVRPALQVALKRQAVSIFWLHHLQHSVPKVNVFVCIDPKEREEESEKTPRPLNHINWEVTHTNHVAMLHGQKPVTWAHLLRPGARKDSFWVHSTTLWPGRGAFILIDSWFAVSTTKSFAQQADIKDIKDITAGGHLKVLLAFIRLFDCVPQS